jgi:transposase
MARQLTALTRYVFGRRSEQAPPPVPGQLAVDLETESGGEPPAASAPPDRLKGGSRKGRKVCVQRLRGHLSVEETSIINPLVAADPGNYREIARDLSGCLERIPGKLVILRVMCPVFTRMDQPFTAPVSAPAPPQFLPGSFLGLQLMVDLVLGKYLYHLPLYRQGKTLEWESVVKKSKATLCQTIDRIAQEVEPLVQGMADAPRHAPCVLFDLNPVRCLNREHAGGPLLGQWRPMADIDSRQAARRVSRQANQMWVAAVPAENRVEEDFGVARDAVFESGAHGNRSSASIFGGHRPGVW